MSFQAAREDVFGLVRHALDAHLLGLVSAAALLEECRQPVALADRAIAAAFAAPDDPDHAVRVCLWLRERRVSALGLSYRLDPEQAARWVAAVCRLLRDRRLLSAAGGGPVKAVFFAGLPDACLRVRRENPEITAVFAGDETSDETLALLGVPPARWPRALAEGMRYDADRLALGRQLTQNGRHLSVAPVCRGGYTGFGTRADRLSARLAHARRLAQPPLMRAHAGPYLPRRQEAVALFLEWTARLARAGHLDVLSIGTSQLTQSAFGEDWGARPNGGGVPINTPEEYERVWRAARPMLTRTYAGTRDVPALAAMHERTLHIAWHAFSFWWFCLLDGRGPNTVLENLRQIEAALRVAAAAGTPVEPNVAHHFSFRGADDVTAVAATALAVRAIKRQGVRTLVLQTMLNTPRATWGAQDLAKARAMLQLAREAEGPDFEVILQPRAGLDAFSHDLERARAQLAAATMLMDDIEPDNPASPPLIHVVGFSEASHLATPEVINESIQITRLALDEYRRRKSDGIFSRAVAAAADERTRWLLDEARRLLAAMERAIPRLETAEGLYRALCAGFLTAPHLLDGGGAEFAAAAAWRTRLVQGGVNVVDDAGRPLSVAQRLERLAATGAPVA